jgi:NAD(P)H-dependent FMN reductase
VIWRFGDRQITSPNHQVAEQTDSVPQILGISGSLRRASFNAMLLRAAAELVPEGTTIAIESIREIPLYDGDVETSAGVPAPVRMLKEKIAAADGLLIATPEYNNSIPGVAKNAIDWLSRPSADIQRVFGNKPIVVMGATPGPNGTLLAQSSWLPVLRALGTEYWSGGRMLVRGAGKLFDAQGRLTDEPTRASLKTFVEGFAAFVERHRLLRS